MWTLLLSRQGDPPGTFLDRRQIDSGQIKVGRSAATCDLVVPDTAGHLSREHCVISAIGFDLFVMDTSTNGVALNEPGQRIAPQQPVAVRIGDRLLLGNFAIEVASDTAGLGAQLHAPAAAAPATHGFQQPDAWFDTGPAAADPIWGGGPSRAEVHDFLGDAMHDFLATPAAAQAPAAGVDPFGGAFGEAFSKPLLAEPVAAAPESFAIPEDWAAPAAKPAPAADPFAPAPAAAPRVVDLAAGFTTPPTAHPDPFALPPTAAPSTPKTAPPVKPGAPAAAPPGDAPDWAAFCEGAGLDPASLRLAPQAMHRLGVLYRQVVLGLSDLVQDRAAFKDEFRVERTQLSFGRNNPLKYLPPLDSARQLLADPLPGFMDGEEAVRAGFEDVKRHQLALLAGVQHALKAVFERLSPAEVDRMMKKAREGRRDLLGRGINPWSIYTTMWEALRADTTSNVNGVMSVAFREGYEAFLNGTPGRTR